MSEDRTQVYLRDCMEGMKEYPDKHFDLAICDPPYGIVEKSNRENQQGAAKAKRTKYNQSLWGQAKPSSVYFKELQRVSKHRVIWGGNYFTDCLPVSRCWIVWDKLNEASPFADCELAWSSIEGSVRKFSFRWAGMLQGNMANKEDRVHPTQKPVALYKWLLKNYAKPGDKILDTHLGSGSSRIAAYDMGFDFTGYEIDPDYFAAQEKRFNQFKSQTKLFV